MSDIMDTLYGPLGPEYCLYFYILSIIGFLMMVFFLVSSVVYGISKRKGIEFYITTVSLSLGYFVIYFQNRLLNTMCIHNNKL
jgi:hypothetical protein